MGALNHVGYERDAFMGHLLKDPLKLHDSLSLFVTRVFGFVRKYIMSVGSSVGVAFLSLSVYK